MAWARQLPHAGHGAEGVGAHAQVRHLAQVLEGVALGRDRVGVGIVDPARPPRSTSACISTDWPLPCDSASVPVAVTAQPAVRWSDLVLVVGERALGHHLQRGEAGSVVDLDERQPGLGIAARAHPALHRHLLPVPNLAGEHICDPNHVSHRYLPLAPRVSRLPARSGRRDPSSAHAPPLERCGRDRCQGHPTLRLRCPAR